jgi:hypothetical protein
MKEFLLVFRNLPLDGPKLSPEQLQNISKPWQDWMGSMAAQNKLVNQGNRLDYEGATVRPDNVITDGPYTAIRDYFRV